MIPPFTEADTGRLFGSQVRSPAQKSRKIAFLTNFLSLPSRASKNRLSMKNGGPWGLTHGKFFVFSSFGFDILLEFLGVEKIEVGADTRVKTSFVVVATEETL